MDHHSQNFIIRNNLATPIAIVIAGILIAGAICYTGGRGASYEGVAAAAAPAAAVKAGAKAAVDASKVKANVPYIGKTNAPLTVAIWTDYQCPFCKRFEADTVRQLKANYVDTGKVRILFKDFAFLGEDSTTLATAARAVWEAAPSKYYAWRDYIYANQGQEHSGWGTKEKILALSTKTLTAGEISKVSSLMTSKAATYQKAIDADKAEGGTFGVTGTPGTIVGKTYINGAQGYATVKAAVEKELGAK